jgi:cell division protein FtsB
MLENVGENLVLGMSGIALLVFLTKEMITRLAGKAMEKSEFSARNDIIEDMRKEIATLRDRVDTLESKVTKLQDRLVTVRTHALTAYGIVQTNCAGCEHRQRLLDVITLIVKED